ncbi:hypothetical protein ABT084_22530 [Streptomyces sp. NPDC002138]|uniref:hypothetical protein n=1 Tax=Streptomyces sp. NPDC002138 TaxID=3154410 RepID=UPI003324CE42
MPDRRQPSSPTPPSAPENDNPYAAPPEGRPDQPWQPRRGADEQERRNRDGGDGPGGLGGGPARWDPTDPIQRRARYALLAGMWGFFLGVFEFPSAGLLLGALALYWGVSALRAKRPAQPQPSDAPAPSAPPRPTESGLAALGPAARPQRAAAVSGLVTASLALLLALGTYASHIAYKDFYICRDDALTRTAALQCNTKLPDNFLGDLLKVQE